MPDYVKSAIEGNSKEAFDYEKYFGQSANNVGIPQFLRYVIIEVISDPYSINDEMVEKFKHEYGVVNWEYAKVLPRNSLIVKRVLGDGASAMEPAFFAFPFFPSHFALPSKPGEHVWVFFESTRKTSMTPFWISRVNDPGPADDLNYTHAPRNYDPSFFPTTASQFAGDDKPVYDFQIGVPQKDDDGTRFSQPETSTISSEDPQIYEKLITTTSAAQLTNYEAVPRFKKRPGDISFEGTNNTLFVMCSERSGRIGEKSNDETGSIKYRLSDNESGSNKGEMQFVVGRGQTPRTSGSKVKNTLDREELDKSYSSISEDEGDPDIINDRVTILLTQDSQIDNRLGITSFSKKVGIVDVDESYGAAVIKADRIRILVRKDIELINIGSKVVDGKLIDQIDEGKFSSIIMNGKDIIMKPSDQGYLLLGGEDADKAILATDIGVVSENGTVTAPPITTTMGGLAGGTGFAGQGVWSKKVKVK